MPKHLGEFEQLLLSSLLDLDAEADGASIRRAIERRTGRAISPGAIYTAMDRMESRGLLTSWVETTPPELGGRRRKSYRLEKHGVRALEQSLERLRWMAEGLEKRLASLEGGSPRGRR